MANFHGDKIWLILGLIRERMTEEQTAAMLAHMPPPALDMWTGFGEQAFKDYSSEVVVEVVSHSWAGLGGGGSRPGLGDRTGRPTSQ